VNAGVKPEPMMRHDFLNMLVPDDGSEHLWHGYPDECFSFSSFADSLVALILYGCWAIQPPITIVRKAIIVDFVSDRETQADVSLSHGWNGAWEFPMGVANTVHGRVETNEQNAEISRHLCVIGTAMTHEDYFRAVGEKLLDVHSCPDKSCQICTTRTRRGLADVFQIQAGGTKESEVHLFAKWTPSKELIKPLRADASRSSLILWMQSRAEISRRTVPTISGTELSSKVTSLGQRFGPLPGCTQPLQKVSFRETALPHKNRFEIVGCIVLRAS